MKNVMELSCYKINPAQFEADLGIISALNAEYLRLVNVKNSIGSSVVMALRMANADALDRLGLLEPESVELLDITILQHMQEALDIEVGQALQKRNEAAAKFSLKYKVHRDALLHDQEINAALHRYA
jgi:hypothetical protein